MTGMASSTLYQRLAARGNRKVFPVGDVAAIADIFEVSVEQLLNGQLDLAAAAASVDRRRSASLPAAGRRVERSVNERYLTSRGDPLATVA